MGKKFYQTKKFVQLDIEWKERLKNSGFIDIEELPFGAKWDSATDGYYLTQRSCNVYRQMDAVRRTAKETYFQKLSVCLFQASFDNEVDKIVMHLKAEGAKITEICQALMASGMKRYRRTVRLIIRKYEDRWGIRSWKPEQLKYNWLKKQHIR